MKNLAIAFLSAALLAACGGGGNNGTGSNNDDDNDNSPASPVSGVAAVGAPIVGGTVELKCSSGTMAMATSSATGAWSVTTLKGKDYPCAARISGGTESGNINRPNNLLLHSIVLKGGNMNITPFTDLMVAGLTNEVPNIWFENLDASQLKGQVTEASLAGALTEFVTGLGDMSGAPNLPQGFNPITTVFKAEDNDPFDELLDQFRTAYAEQGLSYSTVVGNVAMGKDLDTENDYATAYTFPASQGPIRALYDIDTSKLIIADPRRGTKSGTITANGVILQISGDFSGIIASSYMGMQIAQLCANSNGGMKGQYAYMDNRAVEVPVSELKGRTFFRGENCTTAGSTVFNNDGSMTLSTDGQSQTIPAAQVTKLFSKEGLKANGKFEKARAYKINTDDGVKYHYIHSGSSDPFVNDETGSNFIILAEEASQLP